MAIIRRVNPKTMAVLEERHRKRESKAVRPVPVVAPESVVVPEPKPVGSEPKRLCVGTILCNNDELNRQWLNLQLRYLKATTESFDHITYISYTGSCPKINKMNTQVIPSSGSSKNKNSAGHVAGLTALRDWFVSNKGKYEHFLFLDMDAFPIRKDWQAQLNPRLNRKWEIATLVRPENLETRYHSSVLYVKASCLEKLCWNVQSVGIDIIGNRESDVKLQGYQDNPRGKVFTMVRSNKFNIHPLLCGVYYDLFYHHGCGSGRNFNMRARPYWQHIIEQKFDVGATIKQLMEDPNGFISRLSGWRPEQNVKV